MTSFHEVQLSGNMHLRVPVALEFSISDKCDMLTGSSVLEDVHDGRFLA